MRVADIREMGRNTQGVRVINLKSGDAIADVTRLILDEAEEATGEADASGDGAAEPTAEPAAEAPEAPETPEAA